MERIQRVRSKKMLLQRSLSALLFAVFVVSRLLRDDPFTGLPTDWIPVVFFTFYFGVLAWMILPGLTVFQSLEIDREEIRVYFGPLLIRRIPTNAIRSVLRSTKFEGKKQTAPLSVLLLQFESPSQRRDRGERPMLGTSFWIEDTEEVRSILSRMLPRSVVNLWERL